MKPTRTSARQAEAKQRISQIHDPSGSAPPFESTPPGALLNTTYYWRFNPGKSEEIQLLHDMLRHIYDDPHTPDTMEMFKFMLRERPQLEVNIQTKTEREKLKARLLELKIRYIHWNPLTGDWSYWTTYTRSAMKEYSRTPNDADKTDIQTSHHCRVKHVNQTQNPLPFIHVPQVLVPLVVAMTIHLKRLRMHRLYTYKQTAVITIRGQ